MNKKTDWVKITSLIINVIQAFVFILSAIIVVAYLMYKDSEVRYASNSLEDTYEIMKEVEDIYKEQYVNDIDYETLKLDVVNAMIKSYGDKYGAYLTPDLATKYTGELMDELKGIGVIIRAECVEGDDSLYVVNVFKESPAKDAGLYTGCSIVEVNGKSFDLDVIEYNDVLNEIRGKEGTYTNITFIDTNGNKKNVDIMRKEVRTETVTYKKLTDEIAYIEIREFNLYTDDDLIEVLKELNQNGVRKIIFDLRDNPGGMLVSVVNALDKIVSKGDLIYLTDKNGETEKIYRSDRICLDIDSVCLVNENTASAAELFTQTLKDYNLTTVIGTQTYGKGTVCSLIDTNDDGMVSISTSKYLTKSRTDIEGVGVTPDIVMKLSGEEEAIRYKLDLMEDDLVLKAIDILKY